MSTWIDTQDPEKVSTALAKLRTMSGHAADWLNYAHGDERFALWLYLANTRCMRMAGVGVFDLADHCWRDAYDAGESPR